MGMLIHHTWLEQQEQAKKPEKAEKPVTAEKPEEEPTDAPVKRGGRRKVTK